jgi:4'-phosphopantetheinyl transferase
VVFKAVGSRGAQQTHESHIGGLDVENELLPRLVGSLPQDEAHVWYVDLPAWEREVESLLPLLNHEEQQRAARFKFPAPSNQFVISRAILRQILGRYLRIEAREVQFRNATNGKPELARASGVHDDLRFNLSHTAGAAVIAITQHRQVGIDVERIRMDTNAMELAERFFSRPEVEWLRSQPASEQIPAFFTCWTGKEAYIKAHGEGLSMPLSSFGVLPAHATDSCKLQLKVYENPEEARRWFICQLELGTGLRAALAVEGDNCRVRIGQLTSTDLNVKSRLASN